MKRTSSVIALMLLCIALPGQITTKAPSIIFVHGLGGNENKWTELLTKLPPSEYAYISNYRIVERQPYRLIEEGKSPKALLNDETLIPVFTITFEDNQNLSFAQQGQRLREVVNSVRTVTGGREVILFGHSMGGLASRACLMLNPSGIVGLVTVGTPNAGSFLAYSPHFRTDLQKTFQSLGLLLDYAAFSTDLNLSSKAIRMLAPDSPEMYQMYNQTIDPHLPIVCVVSNWDPILSESLKYVVLSATSRWLTTYKTTNPSPTDMTSIELQLRLTDGVVSLFSQKIESGIANAPDINPVEFETDRFHTDIPEDTECMMKALEQILKMAQDNKIIAKKGSSTVGFIIDSSGSMNTSDPQNIRKTATEQIVDILTGEENLFIIDFDGNSSWLNFENWQDWDITKLKEVIRNIDSDGGTNVGLGLYTMRQALESTLKDFDKTAVILLSDGMGGYNDEAEWYASKGIKIYTISYKDNADANLLNNIAGSTGGSYIQANDESDVISAFMQFNNDLMGLNKYVSYEGNLNGQPEAHIPAFYVDPSTGFINAILNWSGIEKFFVLESPSGIRYSPDRIVSSTAGSYTDDFLFYAGMENLMPTMSGPYPNCASLDFEATSLSPRPEWKKGLGYLIVKIMQPEPGQWNARVINSGYSPSNDSFLFEANGSGGLDLPLASLKQGGMYLFNVINNYPQMNLTNSKAEIKLITPSGRVSDISSSYYEGRFQFYPGDGKGNYQISARVLFPDNNKNTLQRHYLRSILVGEILPGYIAPVKQLIGSYIVTEQGLVTGNRAGYQCNIYSPNTKEIIKARGIVTYVNDNECTIKISDRANSTIMIGDIVEIDILQWQNDIRP